MLQCKCAVVFRYAHHGTDSGSRSCELDSEFNNVAKRS